MRVRRKHLLATAAFVIALVVVALLWPSPIADYGSGAAGLVVDTEANPIANASVTLRFDQTVFEAITPVDTAEMRTDERGQFRRHFISCGKPGGPYTVRVEHPDFHPVEVRGEGLGHHRIVLRKVTP